MWRPGCCQIDYKETLTRQSRYGSRPNDVNIYFRSSPSAFGDTRYFHYLQRVTFACTPSLVYVCVDTLTSSPRDALHAVLRQLLTSHPSVHIAVCYADFGDVMHSCCRDCELLQLRPSRSSSIQYQSSTKCVQQAAARPHGILYPADLNT
jgi:hypothetical protein